MSKLFNSARLYQSLDNRRVRITEVFIDRYVYEDNMDITDAIDKADEQTKAMTAEEVDMWYTQFLLEEAFDEYRWKYDD